MRNLALLWLLTAVALPAFAAKRVTVEKLEQVLDESRHTTDAKLAQQIYELELTERLIESRLTRLETDLPGPLAREALIAVADASAFLDLPARDIAALTGEGANHYGMEFGPANVGLHEVSAAIELADGTLAVSRAQRIQADHDQAVLPPERLGHYRIDLARGWLYHGDRRRALSALRAARQVAPQQARYHPMVRETVLAIAHAEPRPNEELSSFATWLGIDS